MENTPHRLLPILGPNDYTMLMENTPIECIDITAPPQQLALF
ncbi:hypothetical protein [Arthrobacter psychrolactophilus]|nr:hypothetical protein [Arthrobacter psychrolactophilus]